MFPNSPWTNVNDSALFVIFSAGRLGFAKSGARSLTVIDDNSFEYDDIIVYKGQFYVIDTLGKILWIDNSSLKLVPFLPPLYALGSQKHLVDSCGALYIVDRYFNKERRRVEHTNRYIRDCDGPKVVDFKVYKLDEKWVDGSWRKAWVIKFLFWLMIVVYRFWLKSLLGIKGIAFSSMIKMKLLFST